MQIIFLKPYFNEKIWGGTKLASFGYSLPSKHIGEAWVVSGYKNKSSIILNGKYKGKNLYFLYHKHPELFNNPSTDEYPLMVKLLDCNDKLSVQVHPKDRYAKKHYNEFGKNECWYFLGAKRNANIIYGHTAKSKKQLTNLVKQGNWKKLLKNKKVEKDGFVYVPTGTIHGLNSGLLVYELQQSSDITFRLYDYERQKLDPSRKLHINESLDNIDVPFKTPKFKCDKDTIIKTKAFVLKKINNINKKTYSYKKAKWLQLTVIGGKGTINEVPIKKGDSFLLVGKQEKFTLQGKIQILLSYTN